MLSLTCPDVPQQLLPPPVPHFRQYVPPTQQAISLTSPTFIPLGRTPTSQRSLIQQVPHQPDHPAGPSPPGSRTPMSPLRQFPPLPLPPPPSSWPAAPHRRGGFLSCTVSMALPAAAQTRSLIHPPPGPPGSRPADPPTLPLSAPTGSGARGGSGAGAGRSREVRAWTTWCGPESRRAPRRGPGTAEHWSLFPGEASSIKLGTASLSLATLFARDTRSRNQEPICASGPAPHFSDGDTEASCEAPA